MVKITFFTVDSQNHFVRYQYINVSSIDAHTMQVNHTQFVSDYDIKSNLVGDMLLMFHLPGDLNLYPLPLNRSDYNPDTDSKYYYKQGANNKNYVSDELKSMIDEYNTLKSKLMALIGTVEDVANHTISGIQSVASSLKSTVSPTVSSGTQNNQTLKAISLVKRKDLKKFQKWMK